MDQKKIAEFTDSLSKCLADSGFLRRFYELFLDSSPEVAAKFRHTDFDKQRRMLATSLYVMVMAMEGGDAALAYMEQIARRHRELDVRPEMYDLWLDCLLRAAREYDVDFSTDTEACWRDAMRKGIEFMRDDRS